MDTAPRPGPGHRADYRDFYPVITRWADNDPFGHVNNASYYSYYDSAVTGWLLARGLIGFEAGPMWMVAETGCRFFSEVAFPQTLAVGMRVARLGTSAVSWELALFRDGADQASAEGLMVHVHVSRETRRPAPIPLELRAAFSPVLVSNSTI
jgi:acyl-CoA thioester hydrolase